MGGSSPTKFVWPENWPAFFRFYSMAVDGVSVDSGWIGHETGHSICESKGHSLTRPPALFLGVCFSWGEGACTLRTSTEVVKPEFLSWIQLCNLYRDM